MRRFWFGLILSLHFQCLWAKSVCKNTLGNSYQSTNRHYCLLSTEIFWNYAPNSNSTHMDLTNNFESNAQSILTQSELSMGSTFIKAVYFEYEYDEKTKLCDWTKNKPLPKSNGIMGPTVRAIVGDKIYIHYFNNCSRSYSIEPHGLFHSKNVNGVVLPGEEITYTWLVLESSGPESDSFSSRVWMYHGGTENDIHSGLIGSIIIVSPHYITTTEERSSAFPCDIDFEFILGMMSFHETSSWYFSQNMRLKYGSQLSDEELSEYATDSAWQSANTRHTINGLMFGNLNENTAGISLSLNSIVRWNIISTSGNSNTEETTDAITWEHNTVQDSTGHNSDYCTVLSPGYNSVNMIPSFTGNSFLIYNVNYEKQSSGMIGMYAVVDDGYESDIGNNNDDTSFHVPKGSYSFFIVVIVFSVIGVIVLIYYSMNSTSFHPRFSDMSPILLESSHHMINPHKNTNNNNKSSSSSSVELQNKESNLFPPPPSQQQQSSSSSSGQSSLPPPPTSSSSFFDGKSEQQQQSQSQGQGGSPSKVIYHVKHAEI